MIVVTFFIYRALRCVQEWINSKSSDPITVLLTSVLAAGIGAWRRPPENGKEVEDAFENRFVQLLIARFCSGNIWTTMPNIMIFISKQFRSIIYLLSKCLFISLFTFRARLIVRDMVTVFSSNSPSSTKQR